MAVITVLVAAGCTHCPWPLVRALVLLNLLFHLSVVATVMDAQSKKCLFLRLNTTFGYSIWGEVHTHAPSFLKAVRYM